MSELKCDGEARNGGGDMTEAEWLDRGDPILSLESERGWPSPRKQRLFAAACGRRIQHLPPGDPLWQDSLAVAERYADRQAKRADLRQAQVQLSGGKNPERTYADLLSHFAKAAILWACHTVMRRYAAQAARNAACAAAYAALPLGEPYVPPAYSEHRALWSAVERAEVRAQIALLRDICGDPFRPVTPRLGPLPRAVIQLAQAAYAERPLPACALDAARLAVLSDALEEAGCADADLLAHLRAPGPHVRGCWALDLLLRKS